MANLKEIRGRIVSVSSTRQITSAMKMVSAAKLKRAQNSIVQLRPYAFKLSEIIQNLSASVSSDHGIYSQERKVRNILIIPVSSNRGLCGAFNSGLIKNTHRWIQELTETYPQVDISVLCAGKKSHDVFKRTSYNIKGNLLPANLNELINQTEFDKFSAAADKILNAFAGKQFDKVYLVYNKFKNAAVQEVVLEPFLPVQMPNVTTVKTNDDFIVEPSKLELYEHLVPSYLKIQFYKAFIDSNASEHGARMTAMHKATDNASSMIKDLKLTYNKARQAAITNEILEIVAGAEALNG